MRNKENWRGKRLKEAMEAAGVKSEGMGRHMNVSGAAVRNWCLGIRDIGLDELARLHLHEWNVRQWRIDVNPCFAVLIRFPRLPLPPAPALPYDGPTLGRSGGTADATDSKSSFPHRHRALFA